MRYRIYNQGQVVGPMELEIIQAQPWFNGNLLLCPEASPGITAADWKRADEILRSETEQAGRTADAKAKGLGASPMARRIETIEKTIGDLTQAQKQWELKIEEEMGHFKTQTESALEEIRQKISEQAVETGRLASSANQTTNNVEALNQRLAALDQWADTINNVQQSLLGLEAKFASLQERSAEIAQKQQGLEMAAQELRSALEAAQAGSQAQLSPGAPEQQESLAAIDPAALPQTEPAGEPEPPRPPQRLQDAPRRSEGQPSPDEFSVARAPEDTKDSAAAPEKPQAISPTEPMPRAEDKNTETLQKTNPSPSAFKQAARLTIIAVASFMAMVLSLWIYFSAIKPQMTPPAARVADVQETKHAALNAPEQKELPKGTQISGVAVGVPPTSPAKPGQQPPAASTSKKQTAKRKNTAKTKTTEPRVTVEMPRASPKPSPAKSSEAAAAESTKALPGLILPGLQAPLPAGETASGKPQASGADQSSAGEYFPDAP